MYSPVLLMYLASRGLHFVHPAVLSSKIQVQLPVLLQQGFEVPLSGSLYNHLYEKRKEFPSPEHQSYFDLTQSPQNKCNF